ncbi:MAG: prolipoprotein diacylglyceryl transferase [Verrucomicrobia bacterium 21-51-4]|nr:MAG: prolipoprotein diacylglyceryl transferase [Verrucomicrobia bacterium 21-51-4]HQU08850.1 prolipoprotein diacylglyceryl transferase [Opitutales bacterium]
MAHTTAHWIYNLDPYAIHFPPGWPIPGIRWYGLSYLLSFALIGFALHIYCKRGRLALNSEGLTELISALMIGVLAGGRLGYMLLYDTQRFFAQPWTFFYITEGGMASHGGFLGVMCALLWASKKLKTPLLPLCDAIVTVAPIGLFLGRIANFLNDGELWGKISTVPWAIIFPKSASWAGAPLEAIAPRHPSQLYEAALEGLLLGLYLQLRYWFFKPKDSGQITAEFLILYALLRCIAEAFREPDASLILGLSRGTAYSIALAAAGIVLFIYARRAQAASLKTHHL